MTLAPSKTMEVETKRDLLHELWRWHNPRFMDDLSAGNVQYISVADGKWEYCLIKGRLSERSRVKPWPVLIEHGHILVYASEKARYPYQMPCNPSDAQADDLPADPHRDNYAPTKRRTQLIPADLERMAELARELDSYSIMSVAGGGAGDPTLLHFQFYPPVVAGVRPFRLIENSIESSRPISALSQFNLPFTINRLGEHPSQTGLVVRSAFPFPASTYARVIADMARDYHSFTHYNLFMRFIDGHIETVLLPRSEFTEKPIDDIQELSKKARGWNLGGPENCGSFHVPLDIEDPQMISPTWLTKSLEQIAGDQERLETVLRAVCERA